MRRSSRRHTLTALFLTALACGGTGGGNSCGGCGGAAPAPLDADLEESVKTYNAIQARLLRKARFPASPSVFIVRKAVKKSGI